MLNKTVGRGILFATLLTLFMGVAANAQGWWNPDYTKRVQAAITNNSGAATPVPCSAEITITPIPAELRADWADLQVVYWNGTTNTAINRQVLKDADDAIRVVFRLQAPIASGATSNAYYVYYGNATPLLPLTDVKAVYDTVLDFSADTVGSAPQDWIIPDQILPPAVSVAQIGGVKHMVFTSAGDHRRVMVDPTKCPTFLNVELYARMMPYPTRGSGELAAIVRTPIDPYATEANDIIPPQGIYSSYAGGFGVTLDGFGDQFGLTRFADPNISLGGAGMYLPGIPYQTATATKENTIYRVTGVDAETTFSAKTWKDGTPQPKWLIENYTAQDGSTTFFNQPGVVAFNTWGQSAAIEFFAMREIRDLAGATGAPQTGTPSPGPFLQGTVSSTLLGPLPGISLTITDGTTTWVVTTDANGYYKITLPDTTAGYTLTATMFGHNPGVVTGAHPSPISLTNVVLTYVAPVLNGRVRDKWFRVPQAGVHVVVTDALGNYLAETTTDAKGDYSIQLTTGGTYGLAAWGKGRSARTSVTVANGATKTTELVVDIPANGDCEIPTSTNDWPAGWETYEFGGTAPTFRGLSREQNHTPGGFWSLKVTDPTSDSSGNQTGDGRGPQNLYQHPIITGCSYTIEAWAYFTQAGDQFRFRGRNNWPASFYIMAGSPPPALNENTGGLDGNGNVPVNQWYQIKTSWPFVLGGSANPGPIEYSFYTYNAQVGDIYFDDVTITATPVALNQVIASVVDQNGKGVSPPFLGEMHYGKLFSNPSPGDENGICRLLTTTSTPVILAGWKGPDSRDGTALSPNGALVGVAQATPVPYDPNATTPTATVTVNTKARNILSNDTTVGLVNGDSFASRYLIDKRIDKGTAESADSANPADWVQVTRPPTNYDEATVSRLWDNNLWNEAYGWGSGGLRGILSGCSQDSDACAIADRYRTATLDLDLGSSQTIDQIEFGYFFYVNKHRIWVSDTPFEWNVELPNAQAAVDTTTDEVSVRTQGFQSGSLPYNSDQLQWYQIYRFDPPIQGQYLRIRQDGSPYHDGHQIMLEMRVMSASAWTPTFTTDDLALALKIAAGLEQSFDTDIPKLDANKDGKIGLDDAAIISKTIVAES